MGKLKNALQAHLDIDPQFAEYYWQSQDRIFPEPVLPDSQSLWDSIPLEAIVTTTAACTFDTEPPF